MPDSADPEITKKLKICLRPVGTKKWSEEFKIPIIKSDKLKPNENILWNHHNTQTIMRKESTENKNVFNLLLLPSLVITNCLPMSLDITISLINRPEDGDDSQSMNTSQISESCKEEFDEFTLYRGQVKHFDNMPSGGARAEIRLHLNDEKYAPKGILLQKANEAADDEKDIVFRDS